MRCAAYHALSGTVVEAILLGLSHPEEEGQRQYHPKRKHKRSHKNKTRNLEGTDSSNPLSSMTSTTSDSSVSAADSNSAQSSSDDEQHDDYNNTMTTLPVLKRATDGIEQQQLKSKGKKSKSKRPLQQQQQEEFYNVRFCHEPETIVRRLHHTDVLPFGFQSPSYIFSTPGQHTDRGLIVGPLAGSSSGISSGVTPNNTAPSKVGLSTQFIVANPAPLVSNTTATATSMLQNSHRTHQEVAETEASKQSTTSDRSLLHPDEQLLIDRMQAMLSEAYQPYPSDGVGLQYASGGRNSTSLGIMPHLRRGSRSFERPRGSYNSEQEEGVGPVGTMGSMGHNHQHYKDKERPLLMHRGLSIQAAGPLPLPARDVHSKDPVSSSVISLQKHQPPQRSPTRSSASMILSATVKPRGASLQLHDSNGTKPGDVSTPPQPLSPWPHTIDHQGRGQRSPLAFGSSNSSQSPPQSVFEHVVSTPLASALGSSSSHFMLTPPAAALDIEDDIHATPQALVEAWRASAKRRATVLAMSSLQTDGRGKEASKDGDEERADQPSSIGIALRHRLQQKQLSTSITSSSRRNEQMDGDSGSKSRTQQGAAAENTVSATLANGVTCNQSARASVARATPPPQSFAPRRSVQLVLPDEDVIYRLGASTAMAVEEMDDKLNISDRKEGHGKGQEGPQNPISVAYKPTSQPLSSALRRSSRLDGGASTTSPTTSPQLLFTAAGKPADGPNPLDAEGTKHQLLPASAAGGALTVGPDRRVSFSSSLLSSGSAAQRKSSLGGVGITSEGSPVAVRVSLPYAGRKESKVGSDVDSSKGQQPSTPYRVSPSLFFVDQSDTTPPITKRDVEKRQQTGTSTPPPAPMPAFVVVPPSVVSTSAVTPRPPSMPQHSRQAPNERFSSEQTSNVASPLSPRDFYDQVQKRRLLNTATGVSRSTLDHLDAVVKKESTQEEERGNPQRGREQGRGKRAVPTDWKIPLPSSSYSQPISELMRGDRRVAQSDTEGICALSSLGKDDKEKLLQDAAVAPSSTHLAPQRPAVVSNIPLGELQLPTMLSARFPTPPLAVGSRVLFRAKGVYSPSMSQNVAPSFYSFPNAIQHAVDEMTEIYDKLKQIKKEIRVLIAERQQVVVAQSSSHVNRTQSTAAKWERQSSSTGLYRAITGVADSLQLAATGVGSPSVSFSQLRLSVGQSPPSTHSSPSSSPNRRTTITIQHSDSPSDQSQAIVNEKLESFDNQILRLESARRQLVSKWDSLLDSCGLRHGIIVGGKYDCTYTIQFVSLNTYIDVSSTEVENPFAVHLADGLGGSDNNVVEEGVLHSNVLLLDDSEADPVAVRDVVDVAVQGLRRGIVVECLGRSAGPSYHKRKSRWLKTKSKMQRADNNKHDRWRGRMKMRESEYSSNQSSGFGFGGDPIGHRLPSFSPFAEDALTLFADGEEEEEQFLKNESEKTADEIQARLLFPKKAPQVPPLIDESPDAFTTSIKNPTRPPQLRLQLSSNSPNNTLPTFTLNGSPVEPYRSLNNDDQRTDGALSKDAVNAFLRMYYATWNHTLASYQAVTASQLKNSANETINHNRPNDHSSMHSSNMQLALQQKVRHWARYNYTCVDDLSIADTDAVVMGKRKLSFDSKSAGLNAGNGSGSNSVSADEADSSEWGESQEESESVSHSPSRPHRRKVKRRIKQPDDYFKGPMSNSGMLFADTFGEMSFFAPPNKQDSSEDEHIHSRRHSVSSKTTAPTSTQPRKPMSSSPTTHREKPLSPSITALEMGQGASTSSAFPASKLRRGAWYKVMLPPDNQSAIVVHESAIVFVKPKIGPAGLNASVTMGTTVPPAHWLSSSDSNKGQIKVPSAVPSSVTNDRDFLLRVFSDRLDREGIGAVSWGSVKQFLLKEGGCGIVGELEPTLHPAAEAQTLRIEYSNSAPISLLTAGSEMGNSSRLLTKKSTNKVMSCEPHNNILSLSLAESLHSAYQSLLLYAKPSTGLCRRSSGFFGVGAASIDQRDHTNTYDCGCVAGSRRQMLGFKSKAISGLVRDAMLSSPQIYQYSTSRPTLMQADRDNSAAPVSTASPLTPHRPLGTRGGMGGPTAGTVRGHMNSRSALAVQRPGAPIAQNDEYLLSFPAFEFVYYHMMNAI